MKSVIKVIILSVLIIVLLLVTHLIEISNEYVGVVVVVISFVMLGMIISELFGLLVLGISNLLRIFFRKNKTSEKLHYS